MMVFITDPPDHDGIVTVTVDNTVYDIVHDEATGDWLVATDDEGDVPVHTWVTSRDGGIRYVLERVGLIADGDYERAPERC